MYNFVSWDGLIQIFGNRCVSNLVSYKLVIPGLFFVYFCLFTQTTFLHQKYAEKCPSSLWCWNSNPQPSGHESPPLTTRRLPPFKPGFLILHFNFTKNTNKLLGPRSSTGRRSNLMSCPAKIARSIGTIFRRGSDASESCPSSFQVNKVTFSLCTHFLFINNRNCDQQGHNQHVNAINPFRRTNVDISTMDKLLQKQGPQSTSRHAEETALDVHVVLQREEGRNIGRKSIALYAGGC